MARVLLQLYGVRWLLAVMFLDDYTLSLFGVSEYT